MKLFFKTGLLCFLIGFGACKKDKKTTDPVATSPTEVGSTLKIKFDDVVDNQTLLFNKNYLNPKGDTFLVTKFNYFISNIVLTDVDGKTFTEPNSYHLVRHSDPTTGSITLSGVPEHLYKSISFMLGVDSLHNVSGAQGGDLDPQKSGDMYWDWTSGYVFFKLEGSSPKSGDPLKNLTYHIGGYGGAYKGQRLFNIAFHDTFPNVEKGGNPAVHLTVNLNEFFKTPTLIDVSAEGYYNHTLVNSINKIMADNYADMISFGRID